jgi:hypothetical protein
LRPLKEFCMENLTCLGFKFKWQLGVIRAPHAKFHQIPKLPSP